MGYGDVEELCEADVIMTAPTDRTDHQVTLNRMPAGVGEPRRYRRVVGNHSGHFTFRNICSKLLGLDIAAQGHPSTKSVADLAARPTFGPSR